MKRFFENQFQNLFLWSPFVMTTGAVLYFSMPFEPGIAHPVIISLLIAAILFLRRPGILLTAVLLFIFGFCFSCGFTRIIDTPPVTRNLRNIEITGTVQNIDYTNNKSRLFIRVPANQINKKLSENKTATIRVSVDTAAVLPKIGDEINANVTLFKPAGPSAPGAFDYSRWAYFNGISATGYINKFNAISNVRAGGADINSLRDYIHNRTGSFLSDALVLGYKNAVPVDDTPVWTATGVAHVWSISGFHMTLVSGWLFAFFYLIFRLISPLTKRIPARYPAMVCAWVGLLFYLFLSGIDVATIRAFLMTTLLFVAFIFGRNSFSMRNVCMAFILIFLINPHYVMQPGFQLSFSAIFGLVWFFGGTRDYKKLSAPQKISRAIRVAAQTSIIATIFTAPFVAYHFYSIPVYGLIGNLLLLPVFSIAIMPLVMIGTITALLGWTAPLVLSGDIYNFVLAIANKISALPGATVQTPTIPGYALGLMVFGFLCLMFIKNVDKPKIFKHANYWMFAIFVTIAITVVAVQRRPVFYATADHELVAFENDGCLEFNKSRASNHYFAFESWKYLNFEPTNTENKRRKCDRGVCVYETKEWNLVYVGRYMPLHRNIVEFCRNPNIDFIVSYFDIDAPKCNHKILRGGFVIYESGKIKYIPTNRHWM